MKLLLFFTFKTIIIELDSFQLGREKRMFSNIVVPGLLLILLLVLIIFGPKKLPEIGRAFGQTLREFKNSTKDLTNDVVDDITDVKKEINK